MWPEAVGTRGGLAMALVLAGISPAIAQQQPSDPPNTVAVTERIQSHSTWQLSRLISNHVGRVLANAERPSGNVRAAAPAATMRGAPKSRGPYASATAAMPLWSVWVGPNVTWSDQDDPVAGNDGHTLTAYIGLDRSVGGRGVVGVIGGYESSDFDTALLSGRLETEGFGVGVYGGYAVTEVVVVDALALYTWVDNDFSDRFRSASYDSERLQLAANITAYLNEGQLGIRPKLGVAYSLDEQEAYRDSLRIPSPETDVETLSATAGVQFGYTFLLANGVTVEPWLGAMAVLEDSSTDPSTPGGDELGLFDLRLSAGFNARLAEQLSLSFTADVSGLARDNYDAVAVGGQISLQF